MENQKYQVNKIAIDASTICQLRCPECSNTKGIIKNGIIGSGFLSFSNFKKIIDENPSINEIELSNWGEIFLNPELILIIKSAFEKQIKLTAGNGVNFNTVSDEMLEALVKYQFGYINISIDGACQETYGQYRIRGNYNNVIENIKKLNYYKKKYDSKLPMLSWQFIIFGHNEHEIPRVKELCKELNMVFNPKLNHSDFSPVIDKEFVRKESGLGVADRTEYKVQNNRHYKRPCCQLWVSPRISWDGKLFGCDVNKWKALGNVFEDGLHDCLVNQLVTKTKAVLMGKGKVEEKIPCFYCPTFKQIEEYPITEDEAEAYANYVPPAEKIFLPKTKIQFYNERNFYQKHKSQIINNLSSVFESDKFVDSVYCRKFEERLAKYLNCKYTILTNSCTESIFLALKAAGIKHGDEVILPAMSYIATLMPLLNCGATPIFADINEDDLMLNFESVKKLGSNKTKAIIFVQLFGICYKQIVELQQFAKQYDLILIEDAAQGLAANFNGTKAGNFGDISCIKLSILSNKDVKIVYKNVNQGEMVSTFANISKAKNLLGFSPKIDFSCGIKKFYQWFIKYNND
jgi:MoaA/NifB/PqqE/SkfB family radical SAM enzyme